MHNILEVAAKFKTQLFYLISEGIWLAFFDFSPDLSSIQF